MYFCVTHLFAQQKGERILVLDFDNTASLSDFDVTTDYKIVKKDGRYALMISKENGLCTLRLPVEKIRGMKLLVNTRVKAKNIYKVNAWNGVKIMLEVKQPGDNIYAQAPLPEGSFDWTDNNFNTLIPVNADTVSLVIGLENAKGKAWFDNLEIRVLEGSRLQSKNAVKAAPIDKTGFPMLRGMMVPTFISDSNLKRLTSWGVNHIRWQLTWGGFPNSYADTASYDDYSHWLDSALQYFDHTILPVCRQAGIQVVIDLHTLPGGSVNGGYTHKIFTEVKWQETFVSVWKDIAGRYKNETAVWGYDIANEPIEGVVTDGLKNWHELATFTAKAIRDIDIDHYIILEGAPGGSDYALTAMTPIPVSKVVYSFHMYLPVFFTHQGIGGRQGGVHYPGVVEGREWNRIAIRNALQEIRKWQHDYETEIYVGEFSAIRWSPGESSYYYLRDCIEAFEEYGWSWVYHAFREYNGWSVEHGNNPNDNNVTDVPTSRQQLLIDWFHKNKK